jgi:hypothetical protein
MEGRRRFGLPGCLWDTETAFRVGSTSPMNDFVARTYCTALRITQWCLLIKFFVLQLVHINHFLRSIIFIVVLVRNRQRIHILERVTRKSATMHDTMDSRRDASWPNRATKIKNMS